MDGLTIGDVIQLDPRFSCWGPALCIVEEVRAWGVLCFFFADFKRDESPARSAPSRQAWRVRAHRRGNLVARANDQRCERVMSDDDRFARVAADKLRFIMEHREALLTAWVAETGIRPSHAVLCHQDVVSADGNAITTRVWVESNGGGERLALERVRALARNVDEMHRVSDGNLAADEIVIKFSSLIAALTGPATGGAS